MNLDQPAAQVPRSILDRLEGEQTLGPGGKRCLSELRDILPLCETPDDLLMWGAVALALVSAAEGNHGVGAVVACGGEPIAEGRNQAFVPRWRTAWHAESVALDVLESLTGMPPAVDLTLYTSLECCPMCTVRLINSGIGRVVYAAKDDACGALGNFDRMPPGYVRMASDRKRPLKIEACGSASPLGRLAADVFALNAEVLDALTLDRTKERCCS
ncbi:nucleoside deaminase [Arhodomonas sp. AD133]|uniref:nucleoside deaminase n=1 Tax=Arhodomonas sp. AD133 TaxID=3415009 RepID=UPI003EC091D9